ncbi:MAG: hypothetical protein ACOCXJ_02985 [Planctomycetota bacterium]
MSPQAAPQQGDAFFVSPMQRLERLERLERLFFRSTLDIGRLDCSPEVAVPYALLYPLLMLCLCLSACNDKGPRSTAQEPAPGRQVPERVQDSRGSALLVPDRIAIRTGDGLDQDPTALLPGSTLDQEDLPGTRLLVLPHPGGSAAVYAAVRALRDAGMNATPVYTTSAGDARLLATDAVAVWPADASALRRQLPALGMVVQKEGDGYLRLRDGDGDPLNTLDVLDEIDASPSIDRYEYQWARFASTKQNGKNR